MDSGVPRCGVFVNYRRDDTGWAANVVADALRRHLGQCAEVFLDSRSISLGAAFGRTLEDGVRRSAVLIALIGPRWDEPPLLERLADPADWVRRELLLAREHCPVVVPLLVDRVDVPSADALPEALRFLVDLQAARVDQQDDRSPEVLARRIGGLLPPPCVERIRPSPAPSGAPRVRHKLDAFLRSILPPGQQRNGHRDRLVDLAFALLGPTDTLVYFAPARLAAPREVSTAVLVTAEAVLVAHVDEGLRIVGAVRLPLSGIRKVEHVTAPLTRPVLDGAADGAVIHTVAGDEVTLQGLSGDQARRLVTYLQAGASGAQLVTARSAVAEPVKRRGDDSTPVRQGDGGNRGAALRSALVALAGRWDQLVLGLVPPGQARLQRVAAPGAHDDTVARLAESFRRERGRLARIARQRAQAGRDVDDVLNRAYADVVAATADPELLAQIIKPDLYLVTAVLREVGRTRQEHEPGFCEDEPLLAAVARLPEHQRECTVLRLVYGFDAVETAALLDMPIAVVTSTVDRALENVGQLLDDDEV